MVVHESVKGLPVIRIDEADKKRQIRIFPSAWVNAYHVIEEDLTLGAANAITHIATSEEIKEKYGVEVLKILGI
jgi:hypothetical protein